uniref:Importin beta n=1 Tax=Panagrolaimus sp. JU765 TaxID=591449 RepID=A0AC34Q8C4_9BILA
MEHLQQFHNIIANLLKNNNAEREAAEAQYNEVSANQRALLLYQLGVDTSVALEVRDMCFVLLRRLMADKYDDLIKVMPNELNALKDQLIQFVTNEESGSLRKRVTDVLSDIARQTIDENGVQQWNTIIQFIAHCAGGTNGGLRETAMILIENVPNIFGANQNHLIGDIKQINVPNIFGANQNHLIGDIKQMFKTSLLFNDDGTVRTAAVRAYVAFVVDNEDDEPLIRQLAEMIPDVLKVCEHVTITETDDDVPLQCMVDLATTIPKQLAPYFRQIFELCLTTASNKDKDENYRQSSMEILVSLCESAPALIRKKAANYIEPLVQQCLSMMTELDDDVNAWLEVDDTEDDIEEEIVALGETSIDRIACALGPKPVFPPAYRVIGGYIQSPNWEQKHAGIFGLSTIGEGCKRQME